MEGKGREGKGRVRVGIGRDKRDRMRGEVEQMGRGLEATERAGKFREGGERKGKMQGRKWGE